MARSRKTLEVWLRETLDDPDKDQPCSALSLVHMVGISEREIHSRKCAPGMSPKDVAEMFRGKAETYAQDLPGAQTFNLLAFYGKSEPEARYPFLITAEAPQGGLLTEAPTPQGEKQQSMRHVEMNMQLVFNQQRILFDASNRMIESLARREEMLLRENHDAFEIMKEMILKQVTDDHKLRQERLEYARSTEERKRWLSFAPALVNSLLGREVFPQSTADSALVETIADALSEDQIQKLAAVLPPELWGPLADRMGGYLKTKNEREAKLKELTGGNVEVELGT
jgi:hypothetical protein